MIGSDQRCCVVGDGGGGTQGDKRRSSELGRRTVVAALRLGRGDGVDLGRRARGLGRRGGAVCSSSSSSSSSSTAAAGGGGGVSSRGGVMVVMMMMVGELGAPLDEGTEDMISIVLDPADQAVLQVSGIHHVHRGAGLHIHIHTHREGKFYTIVLSM